MDGEKVDGSVDGENVDDGVVGERLVEGNVDVGKRLVEGNVNGDDVVGDGVVGGSDVGGLVGTVSIGDKVMFSEGVVLSTAVVSGFGLVGGLIVSLA